MFLFNRVDGQQYFDVTRLSQLLCLPYRSAKKCSIGLALCSFFALMVGCKDTTKEDFMPSQKSDFVNHTFSAALAFEDNFGQVASNFNQGESFYLIFTLTNQSSSDQQIDFSSSQRLRAVVQNANEDIVYDFDSRVMYAQVLGRELFAPGEQRRFVVSMSTNDFSVGEFTVTAAIALSDLSNDELLDNEMTQFESRNTFSVQ